MVRYKTCCRNRLQENNAYLLQSEDRKVGEATDINKGLSLSGNILIITRLLVLYQIYNHLALGPTALGLGDYKSDIELVGCYNIYIYIIVYIYTYIYIYVYIYIYQRVR